MTATTEPTPIPTGDWGRPAGLRPGSPGATSKAEVPFFGGFVPPPPAPPARPTTIRRPRWILEAAVAVAILLVVALLAPEHHGPASWSQIARPIVGALSNDVGAALQSSRPAAVGDLRKDLDAARRLGVPASLPVADQWSDALYQIAAGLQVIDAGGRADGWLMRAGRDLAAVRAVLGP